MYNKFLTMVVEKCLQKGCSEAEASSQYGFSTRVGLELGGSIREYVDHQHLGLRVSLGGKVGLASTSAIQDIAADTVCGMAIRSAIANPVYHRLSNICPAKTLPQEEVDPSISDAIVDELTTWIMGEAEAICNTFTCKLLSIIAGYELQNTVLCNSNGAVGWYSIVTTQVVGVAQSTVSDQSIPTFFVCHNAAPGDNLTNVLFEQRFAERLALSAAGSIEELNGKTKFSILAAAQLVSTIIQAFKGDNILSRQSFLRKKRFGDQLWSDKISLMDDPMAVQGRRLPFDAEGVLAEKNYLIDEGVLVGVLCDLATQLELDIGKPGNAYRIPPDHEIRISPSNIVMKIRGHCEDGYSACVEDLGAQSVLNPTTGILNGIATGYKTTIAEKTPAMFQLKIDVNKLFADVAPASEPMWIGSTFVPSFIAVV